MSDSSQVILSPPDQVYLEKVRMATRRFKAGAARPADLHHVVQAVRDVASFDVEVPTASQHREWELVKVGVKRLSVWYMRYLAEQLNNFGSSVSRLGDVLVQRTEALERNDDELAARVGAAEARLARLEARVLPQPKALPAGAGGGLALSQAQADQTTASSQAQADGATGTAQAKADRATGTAQAKAGKSTAAK